jgi:hypothetical protein
VVNNGSKTYLETEEGFYHRYDDYIHQNLSYPLEIGKTWVHYEAEDAIHYYEVEKIEDITVDGILYDDCFKVLDSARYEGEYYGTYQMWYKAGIGLIKEEGGDMGELIDYNIN